MALFGLASVSLASIGGVLYDDNRVTRGLICLFWGGTVLVETGVSI